jgi:hypothetical protein
MKQNLREFFTNLTPKQQIAAGAGSVLVIGLFAFTGYAYHKQMNTPPDCDQVSCSTAKVDPTPKITPAPTATPLSKLPSRLSGTLVEPGKENLHLLAVMIENHPQARPQSGLGQAELVFEAIAEGGITRFMAVYQDPTIPVKVGPIRSARTFYVDFATELDAFYAHVGGSVPALDQISRTGVLDLNQFSVGSAAFERDFSRKVALEHTMYSSTDRLWNYATETKKWSKTGDYPVWTFKDDLERGMRPTKQTVVVNVSDPGYAVSWGYDPETNLYGRTMAGSVHSDANTNKQIMAKNIILQTVGRNSLVAGGKTIWDYQVTGTGKAVIIQNGTSIQATWKKEGTGRTRYYDASGTEIAMVSGTTWVHLTHDDSQVSY